jgi:hypothetical protein
MTSAPSGDNAVMHLFATMVPPHDVLTTVSELAAGLEPAWSPATAGPPAPHVGATGRLFGRRRDPDEQESRPVGPLLDLLPPACMQLPIAKFGNPTLNDAARLTDRMEAELAAVPTPRLHLTGGVALEPAGDISVWVGLGGDLDALKQVTRGVFDAAQRLQLFVDRRVFRPHVQLGTINDQTTADYLEALVAALDAHQSASWWQKKLLLASPADLGPGQPPYRVQREISLGPAVVH